MSMGGQQFHHTALELRRLSGSLECLVQFQHGALRPLIGGARAGAQAKRKSGRSSTQNGSMKSF